ncbi:N-acetylmuramoyl-L-alanine amidase family protein [Paenibacillus tyrfis]|uniref:N-acetylmuramoyl-L-alanine amidase family protein n=1 Tax=Paenibacillus tyrfis TaxID=1501230 RepID=UPI00209C9E81|nr:N-acetylmuramoyl-L-alanine amidase [Paenibacillus tyrfis]MCP1306779.1 N-acetylmuramoyl-L-alanine amidase [Paenibacillus tyrfis]
MSWPNQWNRAMKLAVAAMLALTALTFQAGQAEASVPESWYLPELKSANPAISSVDVLIDVGHGGIDGGTAYGDLLEKDINLAIAKKTYETLRRKGYVVLMNRMDDYALSGENLWLKSRSRHIKDLAQRSHLCNEVKPKIMISLHVNSGRNSAKRGAILIHQAKPQSQQLAKALQESLNALYGTGDKPVPGRTFYLLKHSKAPTVIVEMGFITNAEDRRMLTEVQSQQRIADAITAGVEQYLQQQKK